MNGYVLIVGNHIAHLPLTSLRVIRGKSLLRLTAPQYATTGTPTYRTTTSSSNDVVYDQRGLRVSVWNVSKDQQEDDTKWKSDNEVDGQTDAWMTTTFPAQGEEQLPCSLFVASNVKINSTSVGLKELHLTSLRGQ